LTFIKRLQTISDVRFGSKADICAAKSHVRFTPESDLGCVLSDKSGHSVFHSIISSAMESTPPQDGLRLNQLSHVQQARPESGYTDEQGTVTPAKSKTR